MTIFFIPNPTQYLNLTTTLLIIKKQEIRSLLRETHSSWFFKSKNWTLTLYDGMSCLLYFRVF